MLNHLLGLVTLPTLLCFWISPGFADRNTGLLRSQASGGSLEESGTLICYMQTNSGETLNLEHLCNPSFEGPSDRPTRVNQLRPINRTESPVASQEASCYFIDANGRPCS